MMTPKERLVQAIETSSEDVASALLEILESWRDIGSISPYPQKDNSQNTSSIHENDSKPASNRLISENGMLGSNPDSSETLTADTTNALIREMREERIKSQFGIDS